MKHLHSLWNITAALLLALGLLAACSQDEPTDAGGTSLPEGKFPLQIGSITLAAEADGQSWSAGAPQTRVSENDDRGSSHWDSGDEITVQLGDKTTTYRVETDGTLTRTGEQLYWTKRTDNVTAWYPSSGTIDLSNQSVGLAYVLKATTENASYDAPTALSFAHALAKVRVVMTGDQASKVTDVKIKTCTSCILNADGTLTAGETEDYIPMVKTTYEGKTCWEANVMPGYEIQKVEFNKGAIYTNISLTPLAGKVNTIKLKVGKLTPAEPITITDDGEYSIFNNGDQTITINGNPTVTLNGITISSDAIPIRIIGGSPTLIILGHTTLTTTNDNAAGIQLEGENTHVRIRGNGKLIINNKNGACIGSGKGGTCGNIDIEGIAVEINSSSMRYGAGIGGGECGHCGNITIKDANLKITTNGAAAIGCGSPYSYDVITTCGNIDIENSDITATAYSEADAYPAAIGCCGAYSDNRKGNCRDITITLKSGQDQNGFLSNLTTDGNSEKVGLGADNNAQKGKVGTITWKQADGTVIETIDARDM